MFARIRVAVARSPVSSYFVLAFTLTWSLGFLLIANYHGLVNIPPALHYLGAFGPALAAITVAYLSGGWKGLARLLSTVGKWRVGWKWLLLGALSPLALAVAAVLVNFLVANTGGATLIPDLSALSRIEYLGDIGAGAALLLWLVTFGFGEELGWRGFALRTMQERGRSWLWAALSIGVLWALWHLPAFFYKPQLIALGPGGFIGFGIGVICGSVLLAWLYNGSGGSVLVVALWHALFDFITTAGGGQGAIPAIISTAVMVWAGVLITAELAGGYRVRRDSRHQRATGI
ncbi:MAG: CPBP family intramembrane glutamic endopeptidase [Chloroflexota bacterium]